MGRAESIRAEADDVLYEALRRISWPLAWAFDVAWRARHRGEKPGFVWRLHGRWCGPGWSGPGPCVTELDCLCRAHDLAYRRAAALEVDVPGRVLRQK